MIQRTRCFVAESVMVQYRLIMCRLLMYIDLRSGYIRKRVGVGVREKIKVLRITAPNSVPLLPTR